MAKRVLILFCLVGVLSCSKRTHPSRTSEIIYKSEKPEAKSDNTEKKAAPKVVRSPKEEFPNTIYVNDKAASKSVDGRLYYDVKGHRYWKNYKDGKYYLFNKSMYNDPDFKPPTGDGR